MTTCITRLLLLLVTVPSGLVALARAEAAARPNILLVLSDDHSVPHLGCYGSPNALTPRIDALAAEGMRFTRAYTTAPQCAPSRASIFTGRSPVAIKASRFALPPPREHAFFTDVLRQHGYWVGLDGRHHHLSGRNTTDPVENSALEEAGLKYLGERFDHHAVHSTGTDPSKAFNAALDLVPAGRPFFLYFGFNQPHRGYKRQPAGVNLFDPARLQLPPDFPDLPEVRQDYADYLYTVHLLDTGFGVIMDVLEKRGLAQNTLVMFMGDNGEALLRGKGTLYDRGTHVPLLVRWPGVVKPGTVSDVLVSGEDLAATLLEAARLPVPREMTSVSFLPALTGRALAGREYIFAERGWHWGPITRTDGLDLSRSVTSKRYRLIYNFLADRAYVPVDMVRTPAWHALVTAHQAGRLSALHDRLLFQRPRPVIELFDLEADPYELTNLAGQPATREVEMRLRVALTKWMTREGDFLPMPVLNYPAENWGLEPVQPGADRRGR